jgi:hypothetical protein
VISQIYGGGGNGSAAFTNDFIELHNRGEAPVALAGWSLQYASAAGGTWSVMPLPAVTLQPGGYFLVQGASGGPAGQPLPAPDATGALALGAAAGKVALVSGTAALAGACPASRMLIDLVGYGAATCFEGDAAAGTPSATRAVLRGDAGCDDDDQNGADIVVGPANPRSSATAAHVCACGVAATLNGTGAALEVDSCAVIGPAAIAIAPGAATPPIAGRVFEAGTTEPDGAAADIAAEVGWGPVALNPSSQSGWTWVPAAYANQVGVDDEYVGTLFAPAEIGIYGYGYRFSLDGGLSWTYCDANGAGADGGASFEPTQIPTMTVTR